MGRGDDAEPLGGTGQPGRHETPVIRRASAGEISWIEPLKPFVTALAAAVTIEHDSHHGRHGPACAPSRPVLHAERRSGSAYERRAPRW